MNYYPLVIIIVSLLVIVCVLIWILNERLPSLVLDQTPREEPKTEQEIPRIIYQTMKSRKVPASMKKAIDTWIDLNPEYEYQYFDDQRCREFIRVNFDTRVLNAYDTLVPGAFKADLWRYCILYLQGGVYVDVDMVAILPLKEIIEPDDEFISVRDHDPNAIFNAFIACKPQHPFLKEMIDYVVNSVETRYYGRSCLDPTGPLGFGKVLQGMLDIDGIFKTDTIKTEKYNLKLLDFPAGQDHILHQGNPCIKNKYQGYTQNMIDVGEGVSYFTQWMNGEIYRF